MSAPATKTARLNLIADRIERDFPDDAAFLRTINLGRRIKRNENGHTAHNIKLAAAFEKIRALMKRGKDEDQAIATIGDEMKISESVILDVWARNRPEVKAILRERGILK